MAEGKQQCQSKKASPLHVWRLLRSRMAAEYSVWKKSEPPGQNWSEAEEKITSFARQYADRLARLLAGPEIIFPSTRALPNPPVLGMTAFDRAPGRRLPRQEETSGQKVRSLRAGDGSRSPVMMSVMSSEVRTACTAAWEEIHLLAISPLSMQTIYFAGNPYDRGSW